MKINFDDIPEHMMLAIQEYVERGKPMGHFLTALFANDLQKAVALADDENIKLLRTYCSYIWFETPADCHGSYEIVDAWIKSKRQQ